MIPTLLPGDVITVKRCRFSRIAVGDIILAHRGRMVLTHRVIYRTKSFLILRGDHNLQSDGKIFAPHVIGRVITVKRRGKNMNPEDISHAQSLAYMKELGAVDREFAKVGISYLILKVLPLHAIYDKYLPRRLYADCDLLVSQADWKKAVRAVRSLGFVHIVRSLSPVFENIQNMETEESFIKYGPYPVVLDIHYNAMILISQIGALDALYPNGMVRNMNIEFLSHARRVTVLGRTYPILSPEHLIVYAALNFFHHNMRGIHRLDFLQRVLKAELRNPDVLSRAADIIQRYNIERFVLPTFHALNTYYRLKSSRKIIRLTLNRRSIRGYKFSVAYMKIFDDEGRIEAGMHRFFYLFQASPRPLVKRLTVFTSPEVLYSIVWITTRFVRSFFKNRLQSLRA
jgi:signal peptidase I